MVSTSSLLRSGTHHMDELILLRLCVYVFMRLWGGLIFLNQLACGPSPQYREPPSWSLPQCSDRWNHVNTAQEGVKTRQLLLQGFSCGKNRFSRILPRDTGRAWDGYCDPPSGLWEVSRVLLLARRGVTGPVLLARYWIEKYCENKWPKCCRNWIGNDSYIE